MTTVLHPKSNAPPVNIRAILSGFLAGSASCVAKVALGPDSFIPLWMEDACQNFHFPITAIDELDGVCQAVGLLTRGVFLLIMIALNLIMVATFLEGMNESGSVIATALSTGTNFSVSAIYGVLIFQEEVNFVWLFGFFMILSGVWLMLSVNLKEIS